MRAAALGCVLLVASCGSRGKEDRTKVLEDVSGAVIVPSYQALEQGSAELAAAVSAYCAAPDASTLEAAQNAWRAARRTYRATAAFQFGPAEEAGLSSALDFWPVREADVEKAVEAAPDPPDTAYLGTLGVSARGFPALEYLLFDPAGAATRLGSGDPAARKRCAVAALLAEEVNERSSSVFFAWDGAAGYAHALATAGDGESPVASTQAGIDQLLNAMAGAMVDLTDRTLGRPLGEKSGGVPQPAECESRYAGDSIRDYEAALSSVRSVWVGARTGERGRGLTLLVRRHDMAFDQSVRDRISATLERALAIPEPLATAVASDPAPVESTLQAARDLRRVMATQVVQVIGGTLTFSDNDGD